MKKLSFPARGAIAGALIVYLFVAISGLTPFWPVWDFWLWKPNDRAFCMVATAMVIAFGAAIGKAIEQDTFK